MNNISSDLMAAVVYATMKKAQGLWDLQFMPTVRQHMNTTLRYL